MPSRVKDKIMRTSHVHFDKGGFIMALDFKVIKDEMI
jgi:hypothetical protein